MDVDLLRPGTVPISPETVLWFEFLLDHNLLLKHLKKPYSDPSPIDLITKFHDVIAETMRNRLEAPEVIEIPPVETNNLKSKQPAKNVALKILSLKVAAFLKWNITQLRNLPFKTQINLLQDLMYYSSDSKMIIEIPTVEEIDIKDVSTPYMFALLLYHRWLLNTAMHRITSNWQLRFGMNDMSPADESKICSPQNIENTIKFLTEALNWDKIPSMLTFECFKMPTEKNDIEFEWEKSERISQSEFLSQINYDLATFFFYREEYDLANQHFTKCYANFRGMGDKKGFSDIDKDILDVYVRACNVGADIMKRSLLEQLNHSIVNHYLGLTNILQQDNVVRDIPLPHRINVELDVQGAVSSGAFTVARDLLQKIKALNMVRCILDKKPLYQYSLNGPKSVDTLLWAIQISWKQFQNSDKKVLKSYLFDLVIKGMFPDLLTKIQQNDELKNIFDKADLSFLNKTEETLDIPESLLQPTELDLCNFSKRRKPQSELKQLERQLISSYNYKDIKDILVKIAITTLGTSVWNINPLWELPIPVQNVIKSLPRGLLQDYSYVLLAKSREQLLNKNWHLALELLIVLDQDLKNLTGNFQKLYRMSNWEVLLLQIMQMLDEWPKTTVDKNALANACEVCLQTNDTVLPRSEIIEACAICLLNLGRWEFLINFEKRWATFEITAAIALTCHEIVKNKTPKKFSKNLWELVLPVFSSSSTQSKRGTPGYHDVANLKSNIVAVFSKLKETLCLTVVISILAKLFNIFKDENNLEIQAEYANLWPNVISNASSYNSVAACEMLSDLVTQALKDYPTNIAWLRLMGDINYANSHYETAMSYYLKSLLILNEYFNAPIRNDDHVFLRMIKCCTELGCYTQAAVLCQFLEKPDYPFAFRILSEQKYCNDAVDAYYHCFWDTNILEFLIHIHNRRGEFQRRKCAVQVIGMLELNSNNNEEIQREASNLRKSVFLRALCKQYIF